MEENAENIVNIKVEPELHCFAADEGSEHNSDDENSDFQCDTSDSDDSDGSGLLRLLEYEFFNQS